MSFSQGKVILEAPSLFDVAGNDLREVQLVFGDITRTQEIDLADTGVTSENPFNLSLLTTTLNRISMGGSYIEVVGEFHDFLFQVDLTDCTFARKFSFSMIPDGVHFFVAINSSIVGFGPSVSEMDASVGDTGHYY